MKRKTNKKGFTLVEVIIAMSVFAIISTGFIMAAQYAYKAQVKAKKRLSQSNEQTTNLEDYRGVIDPTYAGLHDEAGISDLGVTRIGSASGKWIMTYDFGTATIVNDKMYGYHSTANAFDDTFQLTYFSPADQISLDEGEYWITIINHSPNADDVCPFQARVNDNCQLFNNEKEVFASKTSMPGRLIPGGDYKLSFGVKDLDGIYENDVDIFVYDPLDLTSDTATTVIYNLNSTVWDPDGDHYITIGWDAVSNAFVPE